MSDKSLESVAPDPKPHFTTDSVSLTKYEKVSTNRIEWRHHLRNSAKVHKCVSVWVCVCACVCVCVCVWVCVHSTPTLHTTHLHNTPTTYTICSHNTPMTSTTRITTTSTTTFAFLAILRTLVYQHCLSNHIRTLCPRSRLTVCIKLLFVLVAVSVVCMCGWVCVCVLVVVYVVMFV